MGGGKVFMNWIKRAFRSISYHKKNTILMFLSFLILSILILFGLCIRAASRERIWEIRTSIGGSVLVSRGMPKTVISME